MALGSGVLTSSEGGRALCDVAPRYDGDRRWSKPDQTIYGRSEPETEEATATTGADNDQARADGFAVQPMRALTGSLSKTGRSMMVNSG